MILSYSQLSTYRYCPKQYFFRYVEKLPEPHHRSLSFGTSIHNTLYKFFSLYKQQRNQAAQHSLFEEESSTPGLKQLLSYLDDSWVSAGYDSSTEMYEKKRYAVEMLSEMYEKDSFSYDILYLEKSFILSTKDHTIKGRFDRVDILDNNTLEVIDYKTGKMRTEEECKNDLQMHVYIAALEHLHPGKKITASLYFLEHKKKIAVDSNPTAQSQMINTVDTIGNAIEEGIFEATPAESKCAHCSYSKICSQRI